LGMYAGSSCSNVLRKLSSLFSSSYRIPSISIFRQLDSSLKNDSSSITGTSVNIKVLFLPFIK